MSIIKFLLFILLFLFIFFIIRIIITLIQFGSFVRKVNRTQQRNDKQSPPDSTSVSKDKKTITLGKDDYHVE